MYIKALGSVDVNVTHKEQAARVPLPVVKHTEPSLLECDWMQKFKFDWKEISLPLVGMKKLEMM